MAQFARPNATIQSDTWAVSGAATHHEATDEVTPNGNTDYIEASSDDTTCILGLSTVTDPQIGTGHILRFTAEALGGSGGPEKLDVDIYEGTTLIENCFGNQAINRGSYSLYEYTLLNADAISDYSALRVHFIMDTLAAGETIRVTQTELEVPDPSGTDISDNQPCYLKGQDTITDNQLCYLKGKDIITDNQPCYLKGKNVITNNQPCYLKGKDTVTDNQFCYLKGKDSTTDNQSCFLSGASGGQISDNQPCFLKGYGQILIPDGDIGQNAQWKKEDEGTTNLYVSIDETPTPNDLDYVWHDDPQVGDYFEESLSNPPGPPGSGDYIIRWRSGRLAGTKSIKVKVELRQGAVIIASQEQTLTDTPATYEYTLTGPEKANITNPDDLRYRFIVTEII